MREWSKQSHVKWYCRYHVVESELHAHPTKSVTKYLDDYISSYVGKDIVLTAGIQKSREFLRFLRILVLSYQIVVDKKWCLPPESNRHIREDTGF